MTKERYEKPEIFLLKLEDLDVITTSGITGGGGTEGGNAPTDPEPDIGEWDPIM